jgi:DNA-binding NtrC family response regulator
MIPFTTAGLLVDDCTAQLFSRKKVLNLWGLGIDVATTIAEAESKADSRKYAFAMLDYAMPDAPAGPRALIRKLRANSPDCMVFILTAYPDDAINTLADLGAAVLEKPLDWKRFRATLAGVGR